MLKKTTIYLKSVKIMLQINHGEVLIVRINVNYAVHLPLRLG